MMPNFDAFCQKLRQCTGSDSHNRGSSASTLYNNQCFSQNAPHGTSLVGPYTGSDRQLIMQRLTIRQPASNGSNGPYHSGYQQTPVFYPGTHANGLSMNYSANYLPNPQTYFQNDVQIPGYATHQGVPFAGQYQSPANAYPTGCYNAPRSRPRVGSGKRMILTDPVTGRQTPVTIVPSKGANRGWAINGFPPEANVQSTHTGPGTNPFGYMQTSFNGHHNRNLQTVIKSEPVSDEFKSNGNADSGVSTFNIKTEPGSSSNGININDDQRYPIKRRHDCCATPMVPEDIKKIKLLAAGITEPASTTSEFGGCTKTGTNDSDFASGNTRPSTSTAMTVDNVQTDATNYKPSSPKDEILPLTDSYIWTVQDFEDLWYNYSMRKTLRAF